MGFTMQVADAQILQEEVLQEVKPAPAEVSALKTQAETNAVAVMEFNMDSMKERTQILASIESFGFDSMQKSAKKNSLLKVTVGNLSKTGSEGGEISKGLADLHREIKDLDPSVIDFAKSGVLGKLFNPVRNYFEKYEKSENVISDIVTSLDKGKATLKNDNTTLALEEHDLR